VAEQLALEQVLRQRPAIDGDERAAPPRRRLVHRTRDQLLARPGLALDEQRRIRRRDPLEHREHLAHREALADQLAEPALLTRSDVERLRLRLDPQRGLADQQRGARRDGDPADPRSLVPGAVGALEVVHREARGGGGQRDVARRDAIVRQHQVAFGIGPDHDLLVGDPARPPTIRPIDDDQLAVQPPGAAVEDVAVDCGSSSHLT
jgi:hypothetical protein